jgi:hypothetical protein
MMPTSFSRTAALSALALLAGLTAACGDDGSGDMMVAPPPPRAPEVAEAAAEAAAAEPESPSASLITEIDRRSFSTAARDPFTPRAPDRVEIGGPDVQPECDVEVDPLGETDLTDVNLVGLVTGTPVPRAMFTVLTEPEALFLTEGAKIGPNCSFRIIEIRENEVVVEQLTAIESDRVQTILPLNPERVEAEVFANR